MRTRSRARCRSCGGDASLCFRAWMPARRQPRRPPPITRLRRGAHSRCRPAAPSRRSTCTCSRRRPTGMGPLRWKYNHANAPAALAARQGGRDRAAAEERSTSGRRNAASPTQYDGETDHRRRTTSSTTPTYGAAAGRRKRRRLGRAVRSVARRVDVRVVRAGEQRSRHLRRRRHVVSVTNIASIADLDRLMTHEWGHALGLDHRNTESAIMAGPPSTHYNALVTPQPDDVRGCRCLYGLPAGMSAPYVCSLPPKVDFGNAAVGRAVARADASRSPTAATRRCRSRPSTVTNAQFTHVAGCTPGTVVMPGASCTVQVQVTPSAAGARGRAARAVHQRRLLRAVARGERRAEHRRRAGDIAAPTVEVVEYYNASLDHYFITWIAAEIANLDAGNDADPVDAHRPHVPCA